MRATNKIKRKSTEAVIKFLSNVDSATRNEIIEGAIGCYGLSEQELEDNSPRSKNSVIRSDAPCVNGTCSDIQYLIVIRPNIAPM